MAFCVMKKEDGKCLCDGKVCRFRVMRCAAKDLWRGIIKSAWGLLFILVFVGFTFLTVGLWQAAEERVAERQAQGGQRMADVRINNGAD